MVDGVTAPQPEPELPAHPPTPPVSAGPAATARAAAPKRTVWLVATALALVAAAVVSLIYWLGLPKAHTFMQSNSGLSITILFRADVHDVEIEWPDGHAGPQPIGVRYRDFDGSTAGTQTVSFLFAESDLASDGPTRFKLHYRALGFARTADISFDATTERTRFAKEILEGMPQSWVAFRRYGGQDLLYFTTLLSYKNAIVDIAWAEGATGPLDRRVRFTPSESGDSRIGDDDEVYTAIAPTTNEVRVQLKYKDGTQSRVITIRRSDSSIP